MAKRIAKFEKVSFEQFKGGYTDAIGEASDEQIREVYDSLKLPKRATKGSAGYDFYAPAAITLKPGETAKRRRLRFQPESVRRWKITGCFSAIQEAVWDSNSACS